MGILENLKSAASVLLKANKIEQYRLILDAIEKLTEMQNRLTELENENKELQEKLKIKEDLNFVNNAYWLKSNNDGPFCTKCWDKNKNLIRLKGGNPHYECPECGNSYDGPNIESYREELRKLINRRGPSY